MQRSFLENGIRGLGYLPHVGPHPGMPIGIAMILVTGFAGLPHGGLPGFAGGLSIGLFVFGSILFLGAVDRARISNRMNHFDKDITD